MGDIYSSEKRSHIMSLIRGKDTVAEKLAFTYLRSRKIYFQKHYKHAQGKPDIALPRKKKAVFIDGDFWHGRELPRLAAKRARDDFLVTKISGNVERDKKQRKALIDEGWQILAIWESDLKRKRTRDEALERMRVFLLS